jgi:hypothetical protein
MTNLTREALMDKAFKLDDLLAGLDAQAQDDVFLMWRRLPGAKAYNEFANKVAEEALHKQQQRRGGPEAQKGFGVRGRPAGPGTPEAPPTSA